MPQLSGGSRNNINNRLYRMPSHGEYTDINNKIKELRDKMEEIMDENRMLRQGYRKPSPGLNLFMKRNENQGACSTDSDPSESVSGSMNIYSGKSYYRKQSTQNPLTPISSPNLSHNLLLSTQDKKNIGDNSINNMSDIGSCDRTICGLISPKHSEEKQNQANLRLLELGSTK